MRSLHLHLQGIIMRLTVWSPAVAVFLLHIFVIEKSSVLGSHRWWYQQKRDHHYNNSNLNNSASTDTNTIRIVGGHETTINEFPYLVNLRRNGKFSCGGSLLTERCVLTAAHCVYMVPVKDLSIYAGASRLNGAEFHVRLVENSYISNRYSPYNLDMDVAILKLREPLLLDTTIQVIGLSARSPKPQETVSIVGWGVTSEGSSEPSEQLRTADIPVLSKEDCLRAYRGQAQITSSMFCATVPGTMDSCSGDSGGPVICQGHICGIVSWGFGCARVEYPGVYTNIANFRVNTFIRATLKRNCM